MLSSEINTKVSNDMSSLFGKSVMQFAPDADEVRSLYVDKPTSDVVNLLLENLSSNYVFNKN